jgi:hypothetical protein
MSREKLVALSRLLDEDQPPPEGLYVAPSRAVVGKVVGEILTDLHGKKKHLLFGARGSGKSTQLVEICRGLERASTIVAIDLDRSGISVAGLSAFDLLYVIGVAVLRRLRDEQQQEPLFERLKRAYAQKSADELGRWTDAAKGVASFGSGVVGLATALKLVDPGGILSAGLGLIEKGLKLRKDPSGLVPASSPQGRELQAIVHEIIQVVRESSPPIVVVIDGLEKVNGQAAQWFRDTFENTRLLLDLDATMVVASPPCPFSHTNSAYGFGYIPQIVWGFPLEELGALETALRRRVDAADVPDPSGVLARACGEFARASGGHPRHAIGMLHRAVKSALREQREHVTEADCHAALREMKEWLALGLVEASYSTLSRVAQKHILPDSDKAAQLFADGRILAYPPVETGAPVFAVHPLLADAVQKYLE